MPNPLSLTHFYLRNKRKVLPVIGILALAILGVVVTDSLLASARETAYATYGSYQKLILVAPRATSDQDLARPLQDSLTHLEDLQSQVSALDGPNGLRGYFQAVSSAQSQLEAQAEARARTDLIGLTRLQQDAVDAQFYAGRLRTDLIPLAATMQKMQRLQAEEQALTNLENQLLKHPGDITPLISYLQEHQTLLHSVLPSATDLSQLESAVRGAQSDAFGLQRSLGSLTRDSAAIDVRVPSLPTLPAAPDIEQVIGSFRNALDELSKSLGSFAGPQADLNALEQGSKQLKGTDFVQKDAYSNLNINLLAGNAQFDLYGVQPQEMQQLLNLYGDRLVGGRLPQSNANEILLSEEIARARNVSIGGQVGNRIYELDQLPDAFTVVGIVRGPTRIGMIPFDYMTQHYLFERRYQGLVVAPQPGHEAQVHQQLLALIGKRPFRLFDWPYIKGKIDSLIANLDTLNRFLILLVTVVLSLVVGLLNNLFFKQRMNEFGLLAAIGYSRFALIRRVAVESFGVSLASWLLGVALGVVVLAWFNQAFMVPHGLLLNVLNWNVLLLHTLPIPLMVFAFGLSTVAWQLLRMDPITIIERRD